MTIIDAQVHVWEADSQARPWSKPKPAVHRPESFSAQDLIRQMDGAGVDGAILVPPSWDGDRNDLCLAAAAAYPDRFGVMGRIDLRHSQPEAVIGWKQQSGMLGVRTTFSNPPEKDWLSDGTADWLWNAAAEADIPVMISATYPGALADIASLVRRESEVRFTIDHLGINSRLRDAEIVPVVEALLPLAESPNVSVKATSLPSVVTEAYPFNSVRYLLRRVIDAFTPRRVHWGSDLTRLPCTYQECVDHFVQGLNLDPDDLELVMGQSLVQWLNWDRTASALNPLPQAYHD